jgi:hypothetical protein
LLQYEDGLNAVAASMHKCAQLAENFAKALQNSSFSSDASGQPAPTNGASTPAPTKGKRKAISSEEILDSGKQKRKAKDPNAPKRPASSYILFQNEIRARLKEQHPDVPNNDLLAMISKQWADMPDDAKAVR